MNLKPVVTYYSQEQKLHYHNKKGAIFHQQLSIVVRKKNLEQEPNIKNKLHINKN